MAGRRPDPPKWNGVVIPDGVEVRWQERAWMNEDLVMEYVCLLAQARDRVYGPDRVLVLVWDSFRAHLTEAVKILCADSKMKMVVIPGGLTSVLQGLDTHVNKAFKAACRAWWRCRAFGSPNPAQCALTNQDFLEMVRDAGADALAQTVPRGPLQGRTSGSASFLHNGLTNALDGSEDDLINVRHGAVDPGRRVGLPIWTEGEALVLEPEPDAGYGSGPSDSEESDSAAADAALGGGDGEGREVIRRIKLERGQWLDGLTSGAESSDGGPLRGFVGLPGARRSTRKIKITVPKQDLFTGSGARGSRG